MPDPTTSKLPSEVELALEVMPCQAMRRSYSPGGTAHSCAYFAEWGLYHSFDYDASGPPPEPGIVQKTVYAGKTALVPEILSGCRKCPIMAVGINPNLPGYWPKSRNALNPFFDDFLQYAHYFRYRATSKLAIPMADYNAALHGRQDSEKSGDPLVPIGQEINVEQVPLTMYTSYQELLDGFAAAMGWPAGALKLGEDMSYGNMVACPSAKWVIKQDPKNPELPIMGQERLRGIVNECFFSRRYFLRQLFQSLPKVLLVFSQSTANEFIKAMEGNFTGDIPKVGDTLDELMEKNVRLRYGVDDEGKTLDARVAFVPHASANHEEFETMKPKIIEILVQEAGPGKLEFKPETGHLARPVGGCVFCENNLYKIGECNYKKDLHPLKQPLAGMAAAGEVKADPLEEKAEQARLLGDFLKAAPTDSDDPWARRP